MIESNNFESTKIELFADALKALADPARLRILLALSGQKRCVCEIQNEIPMAANLLSHHLKVLRQNNLISGEKRGRWIDYQIQPETIDWVMQQFDFVFPKDQGGENHAEVACEAA